MLGMSYFFYELQRAGRLPENTRMPWRGDTLKKEGGGSLDSGPKGQTFEGGYFDAGDHNKFMLPQAFSIARLAWGLHAFTDAHEKTYFDVRYQTLRISSTGPSQRKHVHIHSCNSFINGVGTR